MEPPQLLIAPRWVATGLTDDDRAALAHAGLLHSPGPGLWLEADLAESLTHRAQCLAPAVPTQATAVGPTAAWVYLGGELTWPLRLGVPHGQRPPYRLGVFKSNCLALEGDTITITGLRLLDPLATAVHLARTADPAAPQLLPRLADRCGITAQQAADRIAAQPRRPGNRRALELIELLDSPPGLPARADGADVSPPAPASSTP